MKKIFFTEAQADMGELAGIRASFNKAVADSGVIVSRQNIKQMELAINEFCENVIRHGYAEKKGRILLKYVIEHNGMKVEITDSGVPYNMLEYVPMSKDVLVERGIKGKLGIGMIMNVCDRIIYERGNGKNKTSLIIYHGA